MSEVRCTPAADLGAASVAFQRVEVETKRDGADDEVAAGLAEGSVADLADEVRS